MPHPDKTNYLITAVLCALSVAANVARADDAASKTEALQPRSFEAAIQNGEIIGWEQVRRVFVTCGTNEFVFVAPQGLRMAANPDKVSLVSTDSTYFLTVRILSTAVADASVENAGVYRAFLLKQFPGAKIMEEFSKGAAGRNGPAFDLRTKVTGGAERDVCVALIPSAAGVLEFSLNADLSKSSDARNAFNSLLRTFRSNENGKLEITVGVVDNS